MDSAPGGAPGAPAPGGSQSSVSAVHIAGPLKGRRKRKRDEATETDTAATTLGEFWDGPSYTPMNPFAMDF